MKTLRAVVGAWVVCAPLVSTAQKAEPPPGAYYSAQRPHIPPLPFLPFAELPVVEVEPKRFVYDDTEVDYESMEGQHQSAMMSSSSEPPVPGPPGGGGTNPPPPYIAPTVPIPGVPLLRMDVFDGVKIISFSTITARVYRIQSTTNLSNPQWETLEEFVATDVEADYTIDDEEAKETRFYRVFQEDDTITFPDWFDTVWQFLEFKAQTTVTNGTWQYEVYGDGQLIASGSTSIVPNQTLRVYDANYDPADWPNSPYYGVGLWEFRVSVIPAGQFAAAGTTHRNVKKPGMQRNPPGTYRGMAVQQSGIFSVPTGQDDIDHFMDFYMKALYNASEIVDFNYGVVDVPAVGEGNMPEYTWLSDTNRWSSLRGFITNRRIDYLHYFGHGSSSSLGSDPKLISAISLNQLKKSAILQTNRLTYVALDGCNTMEKTDFINAFTGYDTTVSRSKLAEKGKIHILAVVGKMLKTPAG